MDLSQFDEEDLLSRVLEKVSELPAPASPRRDAVPGAAPARRAWTVPGILGTTRVATSFGHVPAHLVRVGDTLRTEDGGFERVNRITDLKVDEDFLERHPEAAPVVLRRDSLAKGTPHLDVGLSPAQLVSIGPNRFERRLVPAADLSRDRGVIDKSLGMLVYVRFHLGRTARIHCDGLWVTADADG